MSSYILCRITLFLSFHSGIFNSCGLCSGLHCYTSIRRFISVGRCSKATEMIIRLGRLTPGYFRLLQSQVAGEVQAPSCDRSANQIAMMLAIMGLSLSYYSAKQMTEKVRREPTP